MTILPSAFTDSLTKNFNRYRTATQAQTCEATDSQSLNFKDYDFHPSTTIQLWTHRTTKVTITVIYNNFTNKFLLAWSIETTHALDPPTH